jgi:hypothetical protein
MKKNSILGTLLGLILLLPLAGISQKAEWVNQVLIGNGGKFETAPPYNDYVTMQKYDPATQVSNLFNTIYTQSVQDILIDGNYAYVAAQDSIIKYDINTYQRVAAIADSGIARLGLYNDRLIVTKQWPVVRFFVEILNANSLALLDRTQNISGDCGDVITTKDSIYVAVNGGFLGTTGKLAVINPSNWDLSREINFGAQAVGIFDLYKYGNYIFSINRTPYGAGTSGSITAYNYTNYSYTNTVLSYALGEGIGVIDSLLYLKVDEGVGTFNLNTKQMADPQLIPDPGSVNHIYITSGATDYVNDQLYLNIGDRLSWGINVVATTAGDSVTSFSTGISADAIVLDYRVPVSVNETKTPEATVAVYPNPVSAQARIQYFGEGNVTGYSVMDLTGRTVARETWTNGGKIAYIDCTSYPSGLYFLTLTTDRETLTRKFIKK